MLQETADSNSLKHMQYICCCAGLQHFKVVVMGQINLHILAHNQRFMWVGRQGAAGSLQMIQNGMLAKWMMEYKSQSLDFKQYIVDILKVNRNNFKSQKSTNLVFIPYLFATKTLIGIDWIYPLC